MEEQKTEAVTSAFRLMAFEKELGSCLEMCSWTYSLFFSNVTVINSQSNDAAGSRMTMHVSQLQTHRSKKRCILD